MRLFHELRGLLLRTMIDLKNQTAVVTGGGRGLGRAFAHALAAAGANVTIIARSQNELDQTVASIGANARAFSVDVTDEHSVRAAFRQIGPVDLLVNNAGVLGPIGPFAETDFEQWWSAMNVNVRGAMLCTHAVLPGMIGRRRGRIVNVVTGAFSAAYLSAYLASKTALVRATECLSAETRPQGLALFSIAPGTVRTEMSEHSLTSAEGRRWIPWFRRIFDQGLDLPAELPAALVVALASGKYDALSGLYLTPFDDLDTILAERVQVENDKLHALQIRTHKPGAAAASIAAIRDEANRANP
jgi:NAD(P)-dependent dehydrogenase (short-subunit alcohol dehydrogenase family)